MDPMGKHQVPRGSRWVFRERLMFSATRPLSALPWAALVAWSSAWLQSTSPPTPLFQPEYLHRSVRLFFFERGNPMCEWYHICDGSIWSYVICIQVDGPGVGTGLQVWHSSEHHSRFGFGIQELHHSCLCAVFCDSNEDFCPDVLMGTGTELEAEGL